MDGGEQGDVHLELCPVFPLEQRVQGEVYQGKLCQRWELVAPDLPLHRPEISRPLLVLASRDAEEGVK